MVAVEGMTATDQALVRAVVAHPTLHREYAPHRFSGRVEHFERREIELAVARRVREVVEIDVELPRRLAEPPARARDG